MKHFLIGYVSGIGSVFLVIYLLNKSIDAFNRAGIQIMKDTAKNEGRKKDG